MIITDPLVAWLLAGDVAIQYQVHRDLLGEERPDLRARIATEGWGAQFLAARQRLCASRRFWHNRFRIPRRDSHAGRPAHH